MQKFSKKAMQKAVERARAQQQNLIDGAFVPRVLYVPKKDYPLVAAAIQKDAYHNCVLPIVGYDEVTGVSGYTLFGSIVRPDDDPRRG